MPADGAGARRTLGNAGRAIRLGMRASRPWLIGDVAAMLVAAVVPVATVWLLKTVLDAVAGGRGLAAATPAVAGLVLTGLAAAALPALSDYSHQEIGRRVGRRAQSEIYTAMARLQGLGRLEDPVFHDRLRMAQAAGRSSPGQVINGVLGTGQLAITCGGLVVVLATISPPLAAVNLLGLVPALLAEIRLSRVRADMVWRISPHERREYFYAELQSSLPAAKEMRLLGLSELFRQRMLDQLAVSDEHRRRVDGRQVRAQLGLSVLSAGVLAGGLVWAVGAATGGRLSVGDVAALVAGIAALQGTLASLVGRVSSMHHALLMFDHFRAVLEAEPDLPAAADPRPVPALRRGIELRDVWFRYAPDQDWVLRGVNLHIPHGTSVGLVGVNGAGKSTVVKLLCRFYDPDRGAVLWDGIDLRELDVAALRARIGALFQDYMSYDLSAAENVGLGDVAALDDEERIRAAARRAGIDAALDGLPHGYRTMLSRTFSADPDDREDTDDREEAGATTGALLSGGQWQRLALARTFLRDRRDLLVLDEPSSGLDAGAEYAVHHGLREHRAGATSLLISHRLGAIRDADCIVVLSGGVVAERGTHRQLLATGGTYADLFRMQADGYRDEELPA
ncbi:ABC transporter ATP-binding protein [Cryptosporangium arvum]|uniref:ABC-type multidrug transport system, ATPase and permease component n=1 Tax=Cryptosporangium arvum DSM 44712 TaxID=927661 RepID=A0A011ALL0_9ACTN|nr:ABC transporter ATP-binding protein [Cryptosporangium arvum]EXG82801.1 ABC-type multidrug transport system, ATPase and permease component [Cryptosporangium arvum DSM 44712]